MGHPARAGGHGSRDGGHMRDILVVCSLCGGKRVVERTASWSALCHPKAATYVREAARIEQLAQDEVDRERKAKDQ